ncbi:MAG TPA: glycosyltransferase family 2 protein, partial [Megamonas funiformis]|nr:glycosyltransferase family 2 protein [Megamonas funiformis]
MSDLVSIIIPVFNVDKYIGKTIETLLNQTYLNIEILLIDDGSTDKSGKICDIYAEKYNKIKVFHQKNKGVSSARNLGINNAKGKYIIFVDGDDYVTSEYVASLYNEIIINKADMVIQMYYNYYNTYKVVRNIKEDINEDMSGWEYIDFQILGRKDTTVYAKIYLKNIIDKFNIRFDETITNLEDTLFLFYYSSHCNKIKYT